MISDKQLEDIRQNARDLYPTEGLEGMAMTTTAVAIQEAKQKAFLLGYIEGHNVGVSGAFVVATDSSIQQCRECPLNQEPSHRCMKMFIEKCGYSCNKGKYK